MMIAYAHGACDCPGYPGQSAQSDGHVGGQHDASVSEHTLLEVAIQAQMLPWYFLFFFNGVEIWVGEVLRVLWEINN